MNSEGPLSATVVLVGAQGTNYDLNDLLDFLFFPFFTMKKINILTHGPPWALLGCGPREKVPGVPPSLRACI